MHDSTTTWRIWDPEFKKVNSQSDDMFDDERNAYIACPPPPTNEKSATDTLGLQREEIHVEELERIDAHESGRTSGTGGENHGRTDERTDTHESG